MSRGSTTLDTVRRDPVSGPDQSPVKIHETLGARVHDLSTSLLKFYGKLAEQKALVLVDGGSTCNFVSEAFVRRHKLRTVPLQSPMMVTVANGAVEQLGQQLRIRLHVQKYHQKVNLVVLPNLEYDVLLGKPWLAYHQPHVDYRLNTIHFVFNGKEITLRPTVQPGVTDAQLLTSLVDAAQVEAGLQVGDTAFLVEVFAVAEVPAATPSSQDVHPVLSDIPVVRDFPDVFPDDLPSGLPPARAVDHRIHVEPGAVPPNQPTYRMSYAELDEVKKQLTELLEKKFIQPSQSPYGAPMLFVKKKDGSMCMCIDYRALNKITVKNSYPLPRIEELLDRMQGSTCFTKLDLRSGYHQVRMHPEDIHKTAFHTRYGHYEYRVLPFGLTNAPATFQNLMNDVFSDILDECVVVYLDDIVVYSKNPQEHERHLKMVLQRLQQHSLYAKLSKCEFFKESIEFCGQMVGAGGVGMEPGKVASMLAYPAPTTLTQLRSFLGMCNFYRRYVQGYSHIAGPLHNLTESTVAWAWGPSEQRSFDALKVALASSPVLVLPNPDLPFVVTTDASNFAIGAVLSQDHGKGLQPVGYLSGTLTKAERNYPVCA